MERYFNRLVNSENTFLYDYLDYWERSTPALYHPHQVAKLGAVSNYYVAIPAQQQQAPQTPSKAPKMKITSEPNSPVATPPDTPRQVVQGPKIEDIGGNVDASKFTEVPKVDYAALQSDLDKKDFNKMSERVSWVYDITQKANPEETKAAHLIKWPEWLIEKNPVRVHPIYVADDNGNVLFSGYKVDDVRRFLDEIKGTDKITVNKKKRGDASAIITTELSDKNDLRNFMIARAKEKRQAELSIGTRKYYVYSKSTDFSKIETPKIIEVRNKAKK